MNELHYFLALPLSDDIQSAICSHTRRFVQEERFKKWVHPADYHLTYHFFGPLQAKKWAETEKELARLTATFTPFVLQFGEYGTFGKEDSPRIFYMKPDPIEDNLVQQHAQVVSLLAQLGYPVDSRPFSPHVTIARKWVHRKPYVQPPSRFHYSEKVERLCLYKTVTGQTPKYEEVCSFPFLGREEQ
ncbi:RNA 2',3'-cyclic phosphodiesterase [Shouchella clausii]|uniref:RNA 2',3'-cyclic phosphodiesterase n=1 Tax=Shouchella TaxID=2893057 RepID=UPI000BA79487|nr:MULTISPECIES: RNA 2',3'-cyclic phosphodiesterase [Shouchella]MCM3380573.1 RNA 2',3'-cyclic phosphodiesterase [Shouchella rhizosphaerae]PAE82865.1 RNA 2',3'-cyclic phosphodiesterase [Shouchella clausii]